MFLKQILSVIFPVLICFNGMAQTFEEVGLGCISNKYHQENIQIDTVLNNYENYLVNNGYLIENKRLRLYTFFKTMKKEDAIICVIPIATYNKIVKVEAGAFMDVTCFDDFNLFDLNYMNLRFKFQRLKNQILILDEHNNLTRTHIGETFLSIFNQEDFNNPYVRTILLLTIAWIADIDDGINPIPSAKLLPPIKGEG